jgi:hypothetical protein
MNAPWLPKLKVGKQTTWDHHRAGWSFVLDVIKENFHTPGGVRFVGAVEDEIVKGTKIDEPWVGFIHQVPRQDLWFPDLQRLLKHNIWKYNLKNCLGLFVLSSYLKEWLIKNEVGVPVNMLYYPTPRPDALFDFSLFNKDIKQVIHSGEFLRNYKAFFELEAPGYQKIFLKPDQFNPADFTINGTVIYDRVENETYDRLLQESVVFLNLFDAPANTVIVECMARNTPVLVNKLPGVVEYLGEQYPYYYENMEEARSKLTDLDLVLKTSQYLMNWQGKQKLEASYFIDSLKKSAIYRSLPIPVERTPEFETFDVSVIICSYKRIYNLEPLLEKFTQQDFSGTFEVYIWNNNVDTHQELKQIYDKYKNKLNLKLINSTENYYCIIRCAMASIIKSELMLFCDDDVVPSSGYLSFFHNKYLEYGKDSVICLRGHKFYPHHLNEEDPEEAWHNERDIIFYDENCEDMEIHYAHADNLLISKSTMLSVSKFRMDSYGLILVDDYWFSYILSNKLNIPIRKVLSKGVMQFTECESNPDIAMYRNHKVRDQLLNFYVSHMREGWPYSPVTQTSTSAGIYENKIN